MTFADDLQTSLFRHMPLPTEVAQPMRNAIAQEVAGKVAKDLAPQVVELMKNGAQVMLVELAQGLIEEIDKGASIVLLREVLVQFAQDLPAALDVVFPKEGQ